MKMLLIILAAAVAGLAVGMLGKQLIPAGSFSLFPAGEKPGGLVFAVSVFGAIIVTLAVHELGHLLTGLAAGFRFELFVVFLLGIKRTEAGIRPYLNTNAGYMGGVAATVPLNDSPDNTRKFARVLLAGPLASLTFSILSLCYILFRQDASYSFWLICCITSFLIFLATTLPRKSGMFFTDRARYRRLVGGGQAAESEAALLRVTAQSASTGTYEHISPEDARIVQQDTDPFIRFWGHYYEYEYLKAKGDPAELRESKARLHAMSDTVPKSLWKVLKLDNDEVDR